MKICVLGAGAMGSVYGALLARAGNEVWLVDRWAEHIAAIRAAGLKVSGATGEWTVSPGATTEPEEVGTCDLVVVATKTRDLAAALDTAEPLIGEGTLVLTIQNGLGAADIAEAKVGVARVLVGIAGGFGASIPAPGHVHHNGWELVRIGAQHAGGLAQAEAVARVWEAAGFRVEAVGDIDAMIWSKLICNVAYSAVCCITGLAIGEVIETPDSWRLSTDCAQEAFTLARAKAIALPFDDPIAHVRRFGERIPGARPSVLLDRLAGRPSEIDNLNGAVAAEAAALGLAAPVNATLAALVRTMEAHDLRPGLARGAPARAA
jgi:2-dehydropantoate 2-reductase